MSGEAELQAKLQKLFDDAILGGYNYEARKQAMEAKFEEEVKRYRNKGKIEELERKEKAIADLTARDLFRIGYNVEFLEKDVTDFKGTHYNLKYRQLKEKCTKFQIDLDKLKFDNTLESVNFDNKSKKKELLKKIEDIENALLKTVQKAVGPNHDPKTCAECQ